MSAGQATQTPQAGFRFLLLGRSVPALLYALLAYGQARHALELIDRLPEHAAIPRVLVDLAPVLLYMAFCAIPVGLYLSRPVPQATTKALAPRLAALAGTTILLAVGLAGGGPRLIVVPGTLRAACAVIELLAFVLAIWGLLHLRRSFSIIPAAHRLVTDGPYRLVRHPIYAGEILAAAAVIAADPHLGPTLALAAFVPLQLLRAQFEEALLADALPGYAAYAHRAPGLVPRIGRPGTSPLSRRVRVRVDG